MQWQCLWQSQIEPHHQQCWCSAQLIRVKCVSAEDISFYTIRVNYNGQSEASCCYCRRLLALRRQNARSTMLFVAIINRIVSYLDTQSNVNNRMYRSQIHEGIHSFESTYKSRNHLFILLRFHLSTCEFSTKSRWLQISRLWVMGIFHRHNHKIESSHDIHES